MEEGIFADVKSEGATLDIDKAFERLETKGETPVESQTTKEETDKASQGAENTPEEKTPFHKHPRWQKMQSDFKAQAAELERLKAERTQTAPVELPKWWKDQYGETDESKQRYQAVVQKDGELEWLKQQVKEDLKKETQAEAQSVSDGETYVDTQLEEMTAEGMKFDRNSLLKFMVDFQEEFGAGALLDTEGNYDFRKSLTLMGKMQPEEEESSTDLKKQLASQGGRGKAPIQRSAIPVLTRGQLRGNGGWRDAETGQFTK